MLSIFYFLYLNYHLDRVKSAAANQFIIGGSSPSWQSDDYGILTNMTNFYSMLSGSTKYYN